MSDNQNSEVKFQPRLDDQEPEDWGELAFRILEIFSKQKPLDVAPWRADGGDWTFFQCETETTPPTRFMVGVHSSPLGSERVVWGKATLFVADRNEGVKFLDALSKAFSQPAPSERFPLPLESWKFSTAVLGEKLARDPSGGFGESGSWTATKWFLERDGYSPEVFFNYSLQERKGEFSEKDPEYREELLAVMAIALRDGPKPPRTPENDPNLRLTGPSIGAGQFLAKNVRQFQFSPDGQRILYSTLEPDGSSKLWQIQVGADHAVEVAHLEQYLDGLKIIDPAANQILLVEVLPQEKGVISSDDPKRLWWLDCERKELKAIKGPWDPKRVNLAENPISADYRFLAFTDWRPRTGRAKGNFRVIHLFDRLTSTSKEVVIENCTPEPISWSGEGDAVRLLFLKNSRWDEDTPEEWLQADPRTGQYQPCNESVAQNRAPDRSHSPDRRFRAVIDEMDEEKKLVLTDLTSGATRSFKFHEDDQRFVHEEIATWVSPKYLLLQFERIAVLDIDSMKMNYPLANKDLSQGHVFSQDFKRVLWQTPERELYVSPVVLPTN